MKKKLAYLLVLLTICISAVSCENSQDTQNSVSDNSEKTSANDSEINSENTDPETSEKDSEPENTTETENTENNGKVVKDREGGEIRLLNEIDTVVSGAPSVTEILSGLGVADRIIAADQYSIDVEGIDPSICTLDFYNFSAEELIAMAPDAVIINGISMTGEDDIYAELKEAGITVLYVPSSESIASVKDDITFLAECMDVEEKGMELNAEIDACVSEISEKASSISEKKTVYFEVSAAPYMYSCGSNTFINDMLELIGAENIYASENGWLSNSEESVIAADPDIIITSVKYDGYDYNEICERPGWQALSAVKNGNVFQVEPNPVSRPSQNVVNGIKLLAELIYPEIYTYSENSAE